MNRIDEDILVTRISKNIDLNYKQKIELENFLFDYNIYEKSKQIVKSNFFFRLTLPLFIIVYLITYFIVMPMHYIFVGKFYINPESKLINFIKNWAEKLGLNVC
jgi:hypothetical protein